MRELIPFDAQNCDVTTIKAVLAFDAWATTLEENDMDMPTNEDAPPFLSLFQATVSRTA